MTSRVLLPLPPPLKLRNMSRELLSLGRQLQFSRRSCQREIIIINLSAWLLNGPTLWPHQTRNSATLQTGAAIYALQCCCCSSNSLLSDSSAAYIRAATASSRRRPQLDWMNHGSAPISARVGREGAKNKRTARPLGWPRSYRRRVGVFGGRRYPSGRCQLQLSGRHCLLSAIVQPASRSTRKSSARSECRQQTEASDRATDRRNHCGANFTHN